MDTEYVQEKLSITEKNLYIPSKFCKISKDILYFSTMYFFNLTSINYEVGFIVSGINDQSSGQQ